MDHIYILDDSVVHSKKGKSLLNKHNVPNYSYVSDIEELRNVERCIIILPFSCEPDTSLTEELNNLFIKNLILVASGNSGEGTPIPYPARLHSVLSVGSHTNQNMISLYNNTDKTTSDVYSLGKHNVDGTESAGTSLACVHAAILLKDVKIPKNVIPKAYIRNYHTEERCAWKKEKSQYKNYPTHKIISQKLEKANPLSIRLSDTHQITQNEENQNSSVILNFKEYDQDASLKDHLMSILNNQPDHLVLPLSGGLDSEIVANLLLELNKPFSPVIMRYSIEGKYMNQHDYKFAESFCELHNIKPEYFDLDIVGFFQSEKHLEYANDYYCTSPQHACHLWLLEQIKTDYVMSGDIPYYNTALACPPISYYSYDYFNHLNNINGISKLFWHDTKTINELAKLYNHYKQIDGYERKIRIYSDCKFTFRYIADRDKYTGFEHIKKWFDEKYQGVRVFDSFFRKPMKNRVNDRLEFFYDQRFDN